MPALILGSASPRRLALLQEIGVTAADIRPPEIDETPLRAEAPRAYCERITRAKVAAVAADDGDLVLCADTTVAMGRTIMGKPTDRAEAEAFLRRLSGRRHRVHTAVAVRRGDRHWQRCVTARVQMKPLSDEELAWYLAKGDWEGKAGGYAIQGPAGAFVPWINGSYSAIVGLPLAETAGLLSAAGYPLYARP